ncbi:MAG TPA: PAS domain-containing protein [Rhizomicrobium sp.]|jgi:hypothetical protein|nr:PAS domain-containing protein [Rhizomicrobium sp.]
MDAPYPCATLTRSKDSLAFESFWRSLRGEKLVPARADFQPARAKNFLGDMVLLEAPTEQKPAYRIRVTGDRFNILVGANLTGRNNLDFMPEKYHAGSIAAGRAVVERPCGVWQVSPAHLLRGYATHLEVTAFPLSADETGVPYILMQVLPAGGLNTVSLPTDHGIGIDTAVMSYYIDLGAGVPESHA